MKNLKKALAALLVCAMAMTVAPVGAVMADTVKTYYVNDTSSMFTYHNTSADPGGDIVRFTISGTTVTKANGSVIPNDPAVICGIDQNSLSYSPDGFNVNGTYKTYMWWSDPADAGTYYLLCDGALDDAGNIIPGGVPVPVGFYFTLGPKADSSYNGCHIELSVDTLAATSLEGTINNPSTWRASRPQQTWGVSLAGFGPGSATLHNLAPILDGWLYPAQPTNVTAKAGDGQATVTFSEPPVYTGVGRATGYDVYISPPTTDGYQKLPTPVPSVPSITINHLANGTPYTFTVVAKNANGDSRPSLPSNTVRPGVPYTMGTDNYLFNNYWDSFGYPSHYKIPLERFNELYDSIAAYTLWKFWPDWDGSCFAMSSTSLAFYTRDLKHVDYDNNGSIADKTHGYSAPNVPALYDNSKLSIFSDYVDLTSGRFFIVGDPNSGLYTNKLRNLIEEYQISQLLDGISLKNAAHIDDYAGFINAVKNFVDNPGQPGVVWSVVGLGFAHSVVPYGYKDEGNGAYTLNIYDCNYPDDKNRMATIYTTGNQSWAYYLDLGKNTWARGDNAIFTYVLSDDVFNAINSAEGTGGGQGKGSSMGPGNINILANSNQVTITNDQGINIDNIPDAHKIITTDTMIGGTPNPNIMYDTPAGTYTVTPTAGQGVSARFFNNDQGIAASVSNSGASITGNPETGVTINGPDTNNFTMELNNTDPGLVNGILDITGVSNGPVTGTIEGDCILLSGDGTATATNGIVSKDYSFQPGNPALVDLTDVIAVKSVTISASASTVKKGTTIQLNARIDPPEAADQRLTWSSSNDNVATVSANGLVTGLKTGTVRITATAPNGKNYMFLLMITA